MSELAIRTALQDRLSLLAPTFPTAWQNEPFTPEPQTAYQRVTLMPADPLTPEMSRTLTIEFGILQIMLYYPKNGGVGEVGTKAAAIKAHFYRGLSLVSGGVTVTISGAPAVGQGVNAAVFYEVPVRIPYYANIINP